VPRRAQPDPRPRHARLVLLAAVVACATLLAAPSATPRGEVLDLVSGTAPGPGTVVGAGEPTPEPSPAPTPASTPGATPASTPRPHGPGSLTERLLIEDPAPTAPPVAALEDYVWPIAHPRLTLPFGPTPWGTRVVDGELFHDGIDLATLCGDRIVAAHEGAVLAAGRHFDDYLGWIGDLEPYYSRLDRTRLWASLPIVVVIDDGNGYRSVYAHFGRITVKPGQAVQAGQLLGYEGATGHASGCHLHYGLFSPWERDTFGIEPGVAKRMRLPKSEIARIDPLLVLPPKKGIDVP
jgi:murein DD-endopeptidase MepM/ murein hydrolase activator NlpD